mmetsp:Transcript_12690/g.34077  ORF Transcript_12690/g.34077 Transcript_12690/m.34077 type:complete len:211 (+) Transcript_12690:340-972(+)
MLRRTWQTRRPDARRVVHAAGPAAGALCTLSRHDRAARAPHLRIAKRSDPPASELHERVDRHLVTLRARLLEPEPRQLRIAFSSNAAHVAHPEVALRVRLALVGQALPDLGGAPDLAAPRMQGGEVVSSLGDALPSGAIEPLLGTSLVLFKAAATLEVKDAQRVLCPGEARLCTAFAPRQGLHVVDGASGAVAAHLPKQVRGLNFQLLSC